MLAAFFGTNADGVRTGVGGAFFAAVDPRSERNMAPADDTSTSPNFFCGTRPLDDSACLWAGGLAALGGGGVGPADAENACAAAATRPKFMDGAGSLSVATDDADLDGTMGGGDPVEEAFPDTALPARCMPAVRARDVAGFARARCAAVKAAAAAGAAGIDDCISAPSPVPPTRARRSGLEAKYSSRRAKNASFSCVGRLANGIHR